MFQTHAGATVVLLNSKVHPLAKSVEDGVSVVRLEPNEDWGGKKGQELGVSWEGWFPKLTFQQLQFLFDEELVDLRKELESRRNSSLDNDKLLLLLLSSINRNKITSSKD
jgi:hypothetical protein